jgi:hypothetical protein
MKETVSVEKRQHDTQHNDTQHNERLNIIG